MPVYEYRCGKGHEFEVLQRMSDPPVTECSQCGAAVQRVFHAPAIHFKGSGFYNTDYGKRKSGPSSDGGESRTDGADAKSDGAKADGSSSKSDSGGDSSKTKTSEKAASS